MWISTAYAQTATDGGGAAGGLLQFLPLILIFLIFYFLMIRPQQRRLKQHQAMIEAVKRGDTVVTGGGLIGKVIRVQDNEVQIELSEGVRVKAVKSTLSDVRTKGEPSADSAGKAE